jgi:hypothetical protein
MKSVARIDSIELLNHELEGNVEGNSCETVPLILP